MNRILLSLAIVVFSVSVSHAADEPAGIIDKAIKAAGGAEKLAKVKAEEWKAKGTFHGFGMKLPYEIKYIYARSGSFRFDMDAGGMKITAATDGKTAWEQANGETRDMEKKKAEAFHHQVYSMGLSSLLPLKEKDFTLTGVDDIKVDGKELVGVKASKKGHEDVTLYFDKKSSLLVMIKTKIWHEFTDKIVDQEVFFFDYKEKDGVPYFNKMTIKRAGELMIEEEFSDHKQLDKVDATLFARP